MEVYKLESVSGEAKVVVGSTDCYDVVSSVGGANDYGISYYDPTLPSQPQSQPQQLVGSTVTKKEDFEERPPCIFTPPQQVTVVSTPADALYSTGPGSVDGGTKDYHHPPHYTTLVTTNSNNNSVETSPNGSVAVVSSGGGMSVHSQTGITVIYDNKPMSMGNQHGNKQQTSNKTSKSDQNFAAADSNSNTPSKSFIPCKVCGDKASGYHYGVTSCEGCKGFFRRSIQKQIEYRCLRDGKCLVIRLNRNRCQYCRFKKCLAVGMSRDSVRYGRVPKRSRERNDEARVTQSEAEQSARELENKQLAIYDIILTISQAHHANCSYTEEKTRGIVRKPVSFGLPEIVGDGEMTQDTMDSIEEQKIIMWQNFAMYVTLSIQRVVEFAKRAPGFTNLNQDDQLILIKNGFFEIWMIHISRMIEPMDNTLTFCDGSYVSRQQLDLIFDHEFVTALFTFGVTFNNLQLNDTEIGIFSAVVLLTADRPGISDHGFIEQQQDKLIEALKLQIARNHGGDGHLFTSVWMKISELRTLGNKHGEHLQWFRMQWNKCKLPPLFAEIFDIPKCEQDLLQ
ncbi:hypothetical protein CHUAL_012184 [Chamberlinius hualienensis]